jgi:hypothetical protein
MFMNAPPPTIYAQIQTGNANAQSSVETNIQGSGNVSTHIEVEANGEKKTLDANSPGTYTLGVQSNTNSTQNPTPVPKGLANPNAATATPNMTKESEIHKPSFFSNVMVSLQNFLKRIFNNL